MKTQVFKKTYDKDKFLEFLNKYCEKTSNGYLIFSKMSFKKMKLDKVCQPFFDELKEYYHKSKRFYVDRSPIYKYFVTGLKQLCRQHIIPYTSRIIYVKSTYEIYYCIFYKSPK